MRPTLRDKLATLHESAKTLHEETDALNTLYKQLEKSLQGVGVAFWWDTEHFDFKAGNAEQYEAYVIIGYVKLGDQWCLATKYVQRDPATAGKIEAFEPVPLTRAARGIRLEFAPRVEDFVDALIAEVAKTRLDVECAKNQVARSIEGAK